MILARLAALYDRLLATDDVEAPGFERRPIAFLLVLDNEGRLLDVIDTRSADGREKRGRVLRVPQAVNRSRNVLANLLWDNAEYVLGLPRDATSEGSRAEVTKRHAAFRSVIEALPSEVQQDPGIIAVRAFLRVHDSAAFAVGPFAAKLNDPTANLTFALNFPDQPICESALLAAALGSEAGLAPAQCLITGRLVAPARLHPALKGIVGGQPAGVRLVSFNDPAYESFGLSQGANAPVAVSAANAYGTALNWLLASPDHRLRLGPLTVVAWSEQKSPEETFLADLFGDPPREEPEPDRLARATRVQTLLAAPRTGIAPEAPETEFFVLGLSPNAARAAVALWEQGSLLDTLSRVRRWFDELQVGGRPDFLPDRVSLPSLLRALAPLGEPERLPPRFPASLLSAAITGGRLPGEVLGHTLARLRVPHKAAAGYALTALLRLVLARNHTMELPVSLDPHSADPAYRWGRLFAVFELVQADAQPGINATVRDRFWASAAATPSLVFGSLSRLNGHHLRKLDEPKRRRAERAIGDIMSGIPASAFPTRLSLPDQGRFAVGYWHQRADWFTARAPTTTADLTAITIEI